MPKAPETYRPPAVRADHLQQHEAEEDQGQRGGGGLYQSYLYIKFRERMKAMQRVKDAARIHDIYEGLEVRSFKDYLAFLNDIKANPLCLDCLDEGKIKPGRVMDHIIPIEQGGSIWDPKNLAWRCDHHHNIKRATEDKKQ